MPVIAVGAVEVVEAGISVVAFVAVVAVGAVEVVVVGIAVVAVGAFRAVVAVVEVEGRLKMFTKNFKFLVLSFI